MTAGSRQSPAARAGGSDPAVRFCRATAVVFFAVAAYTVAVKLPGGGLAGDWVHTVLHVVTGAVAVYAGWLAVGPAPRVFTWALVGVYGPLGVMGWFVDGLAAGSPFAIPLSTADNLFHLALAAAGVAVVATAPLRR